jgi:restriction system protein
MMAGKKSLTFLEAAKAVLEEMKQPMHFKKITELAIQKKYLRSGGKTPEWTMGARLSVDVKEKGLRSEFIRTDSGKYGLRKWRRGGTPKSLPGTGSNSRQRGYWLVAVEPANFHHDVSSESLDTIGVKYRMRRTLARVKPGDKVVLYLKKVAEFGAILTIVGDYFIDESQRWPVDGILLSARINATPDIILSKESRVDARQLYSRLVVFTQYPEKHRTLALRNGITEISESDYQIIRKKMKK